MGTTIIPASGNTGPTALPTATAGGLPGNQTDWVQVPFSELTFRSGSDVRTIVSTAISAVGNGFQIGLTGNGTNASVNMQHTPWWDISDSWLEAQGIKPDFSVRGGLEAVMEVSDWGVRAQGLSFGLRRDSNDYGIQAGWLYQTGTAIRGYRGTQNSWQGGGAGNDQPPGVTENAVLVRMMWNGDMTSTAANVAQTTSAVHITNDVEGIILQGTYEAFSTGDNRLGIGAHCSESTNHGEGTPTVSGLWIRLLDNDNTAGGSATP